MATVVVRHKVGDFDTWMKGHQERVELFAPAMSSFKTFRDTNDPNAIVIVAEVTDMEKMQAMMSDPAHADAKERHTVIEPIEVSMPVAVPEFSRA